MIETLRLENIAIVESAELEFGPGLNVLTGETGAGKSLVLGALSLLVGARASSSSLRDGAERGRVEAVFRTESLPELEHLLADRGLLEDGAAEGDPHELVVSRSLARSGRTRNRVAGQLVPVSTLADLFSGRIEISSQHSSQALLRPETHGASLDASGGLAKERAAVQEGYARLRAIDGELDALRTRAEERARRTDFLAFQIQEIDAAGLDAGELAEIERDRGRLVHAERLREDGAAALFALEGDPDGSRETAGDWLASALATLGGLEELDPGLSPLVERLRGCEAELRDVASELERSLAGIDADPARLAVIDERLASVDRLRRKYGTRIEEVIAYRDEIAEELAGLEDADERSAALEQERAAARAELESAARKLTRGRRKAAKALCAKVEGALADLSMPEAKFEVAMDRAVFPDDVPCAATGAEAPHFLFSANRGETPRALQQVASGGELSRVFLALKTSLRRASAGMVLVFDEVDAGIGGGVAERVGRTLAELAGHHQVLCITHLPQIAAFADAHFRIRKQPRGDRTLAVVERLSGDDRVEEIARMAGGESVGDATLRHAEELLRVRTTR